MIVARRGGGKLHAGRLCLWCHRGENVDPDEVLKLGDGDRLPLVAGGVEGDVGGGALLPWIVHGLEESGWDEDAAANAFLMISVENGASYDVQIALALSEIPDAGLNSFPEPLIIVAVLWDHISKRKGLVLGLLGGLIPGRRHMPPVHSGVEKVLEF